MPPNSAQSEWYGRRCHQSSTAENMDESIEITTEAPPDNLEASPAMMEAILKAISELDIATHADVIELNKRQDAQNARIEAVETALAELPTIYASADTLSKIKSSQEEYEASRRALTKQVADLANVVTDIQPKFATIENRLNSITRDITTMTGNLTTFIETQREAVMNQQSTVTEVKAATAALTKKVTFVETTQADAERRYNESHNPLRDYVMGSETQEGLKSTIGRVTGDLNSLRTEVSHHTAEAAIIAGYVKAQQARDEARAQFWQRVRLNMATPRGLFAMMFMIVFILMIANAFSLDQLFARLGQFFVMIGLVKVG